MTTNEINRISAPLLVLVAAVSIRLAALAVVPVETKPWDDSAQYINLAGSVADGHGYQLSEGNFWPGKPTLVRAPGWPVLLAVPFKVVPWEWRRQTARAVAVAVDVLNAMLIMMLAKAIGGSRLSVFLAGGLYALNPVTAAFSAQAASEPCGIMFLLLFLVLGVGSGERRARGEGCGKRERVAGAESASHIGEKEEKQGSRDIPFPLLNVGGALRRGDSYSIANSSFRYLLPGLMLGLACLVRANWLAIAVCFGLGFCWINRRRWRSAVAQMLVFGIAVAIPVMPWLVRNNQVFGHFPILGAGGGETFFGGNNALAADRHSPMWGYIVQPGGIPDAVPLVVLAAKMNEYEVDRYWMKQGWDWLKSNPRKIPGLVAGKLRRAFVPIPYNSRSPMVLASSAYRAFLYLATAVGIILMVRRRTVAAADKRWMGDGETGHAISGAATNCVPAEVWLLFGSVAVATVMTTVVFCGVMRYVIGFEVLLCVPAGWVAGEWVKRGTFHFRRG